VKTEKSYKGLGIAAKADEAPGGLARAGGRNRFRARLGCAGGGSRRLGGRWLAADPWVGGGDAGECKQHTHTTKTTLSTIELIPICRCKKNPHSYPLCISCNHLQLTRVRNPQEETKTSMWAQKHQHKDLPAKETCDGKYQATNTQSAHQCLCKFRCVDV